MKQTLLFFTFGLFAISNNAWAEDTNILKFPKSNSQIEIPANCKLDNAKDQKKFKVKCTEPKITATYHTGEYAALKDSIVKMHKDSQKMFESKGLKVLGEQELQTQPVKSGGEVVSFVIVMEKKAKQKIKIAQFHILMTSDKKSAITIVQTYDPSQEKEKINLLIKQLTAIKPLKK